MYTLRKAKPARRKLQCAAAAPTGTRTAAKPTADQMRVLVIRRTPWPRTPSCGEALVPYVAAHTRLRRGARALRGRAHPSRWRALLTPPRTRHEASAATPRRMTTQAARRGHASSSAGPGRASAAGPPARGSPRLLAATVRRRAVTPTPAPTAMARTRRTMASPRQMVASTTSRHTCHSDAAHGA